MTKIDFFSNQYRDKLFELFQEWDAKHSFDKQEFMKSLECRTEFSTQILLAIENDELLGYAQIAKVLQIGFLPYYEIVQLLVSEKRRGQGIGGLLLQKIEQIASAEQIKIIKLSSQLHRSRSHVFYENSGYELEKLSKFYRKVLE